MKKIHLLLIPIMLAGCSDKGEEYRAEVNKKYDEIKNNNNPSALFRVAESMKETGNFELAAKSYKQAVQIDPTMTDAYLGLSHCLRLTGRPSAALQALNNMPQDLREARWYKELGAVQTVAQKPKACIEAYNRAYEVNPSDAGTLNGIAVCHDLMGQHLEAQKWYKLAMEASPLDTNLKSNYGLSLALSSRPHEAVTTLQEVVESESSTPRDRQNLAVAYGLAGDMDSAAKLFAQDLSENEVRRNLAFIHKLASTQHLAKVPQKSPQAPQFETQLANKATQPAPIAQTANIQSNALPPQGTGVAAHGNQATSQVRDVPAQTNEVQAQSNEAGFLSNWGNWGDSESQASGTEEWETEGEAPGQPALTQAAAQVPGEISRDSHVVVAPLPTKETYHDTPIPSIVQQVKQETHNASSSLAATAPDHKETAEHPYNESITEAGYVEDNARRTKKIGEKTTKKAPVKKPAPSQTKSNSSQVKKNPPKATAKKPEPKKNAVKKKPAKHDDKKHS